MERFATGFAPARATKPGFVIENEKFRVTFEGVSSSMIKELTQSCFKVICNDVKNIISHGFETCYDWRPVMELLLESATDDYWVKEVCRWYLSYFDLGSQVDDNHLVYQDIEVKAKNKLGAWLTSFQVVLTLLTLDADIAMTGLGSAVKYVAQHQAPSLHPCSRLHLRQLE